MWEIWRQNIQKVLDSLPTLGLEIQHTEKFFAGGKRAIVPSLVKDVIDVIQKPYKRSPGKITCFTELLFMGLLVEQLFISMHKS